MLKRVVLPVLAALVLIPRTAIAQITFPGSTATALPPVTTVLPENTAGVLLINLRPQAWREFERFQLVSDLLSSFGMFIPPILGELEEAHTWLGDHAAVAILPTAPELRGISSQVLLIAPVKDPDRLQAAIALIEEQRSEPPIERQYKGITLLEWEPPAPEPDSEMEESEDSELEESELEALPDPDASEEDETLDNSEPEELEGEASEEDSAGSESAEAELDISEETALEETTPEETAELPLDPESESEWEEEESSEEEPDWSEPTPARQRGLAIAQLPGFVVIATQTNSLEQLIDAQAGLTPLSQSPQFQKTLQNPAFGRSLVVGYGNLIETSRLTNALEESLDDSLNDLPALPIPLPIPSPATFLQLLQPLAERYSAVDSFLWLQPEGIRGQFSTYYQVPNAGQPAPPSPASDQILSRLPASTYGAITGHNLKAQWQTWVDLAETNSEVNFVVDIIRELTRDLTGLDLDQDILSWMDGNYSAFLFPTQGGVFPAIEPKLQLGIGLILETSDRAAADNTLQKLDQTLQSLSEGEVATVQRTLQGQSITSWELPDGGSQQSVAAYGWLDQNTLLLTTGTGAMRDLNPRPYLTLPQSYTFRTATQSLPKPNQGYAYLNMGSSLSLLYGLFLSEEEDSFWVRQLQQALSHLYSVSASTSITADKEQFDLHFVLAPTRPALGTPTLEEEPEEFQEEPEEIFGQVKGQAQSGFGRRLQDRNQADPPESKR